LATSKLVKPHTPHPTPHTLPPPKNLFSKPSLTAQLNLLKFYQPSCCPEVNPAERVWLYLKNFLAWETFESLDALRDKLNALLNRLSNDTIGYLTGWSWILEALCLSGIEKFGIVKFQYKYSQI
jgi:transposase